MNTPTVLPKFQQFPESSGGSCPPVVPLPPTPMSNDKAITSFLHKGPTRNSGACCSEVCGKECHIIVPASPRCCAKRWFLAIFCSSLCYERLMIYKWNGCWPLWNRYKNMRRPAVWICEKKQTPVMNASSLKKSEQERIINGEKKNEVFSVRTGDPNLRRIYSRQKFNLTLPFKIPYTRELSVRYNLRYLELILTRIQVWSGVSLVYLNFFHLTFKIASSSEKGVLIVNKTRASHWWESFIRGVRSTRMNYSRVNP